ncbi:hypothetical protein AAE478_006108 [Parahypoxylon ruwenzoriense]
MLAQLTAVLAALATTATALNATGPFVLRITGKTDSSINGYAGACHAGAGIEGLCYTPGAAPADASSSYSWYYNYTSSDSSTGAPIQPGYLTWLLPLVGENTTISVPSAMRISSNWGSNVQTALVFPGLEGGTPVYYHAANGTLYIQGGYDDSSFNSTAPTSPPTLGNLTNFHLCYQYTGGYYYHSVAWVSTQPPHNPSCRPVDLSMQDLPLA